MGICNSHRFIYTHNRTRQSRKACSTFSTLWQNENEKDSTSTLGAHVDDVMLVSHWTMSNQHNDRKKWQWQYWLKHSLRKVIYWQLLWLTVSLPTALPGFVYISTKCDISLIISISLTQLSNNMFQQLYRYHTNTGINSHLVAPRPRNSLNTSWASVSLQKAHMQM